MNETKKYYASIYIVMLYNVMNISKVDQNTPPKKPQKHVINRKDSVLKHKHR